MSLFRKDKKQETIIPKLTNIIIKINRNMVDKWIEGGGEIKPENDGNWDTYYDIKTYEIQLLPIEEFTFFHKRTQSFSKSLNANITISSEKPNDIYVVYWDWNEEFFRAYIDVGHDDGSAGYRTIIAFPIEEVLHLIRYGVISNNISLRGSENTLKVSDELDCSSVWVIKRKEGVKYSNELFSFWAYCPPVDDFQLYD